MRSALGNVTEKCWREKLEVGMRNKVLQRSVTENSPKISDRSLTEKRAGREA